MKWFKVTMKYFDGKAIKCTDVLQVESVEAVYAYYETNVDMYCHILKVTEITPKKAQRLLKKMYSIEF